MAYGWQAIRSGVVLRLLLYESVITSRGVVNGRCGCVTPPKVCQKPRKFGKKLIVGPSNFQKKFRLVSQLKIFFGYRFIFNLRIRVEKQRLHNGPNVRQIKLRQVFNGTMFGQIKLDTLQSKSDGQLPFFT